MRRTRSRSPAPAVAAERSEAAPLLLLGPEATALEPLAAALRAAGLEVETQAAADAEEAFAAVVAARPAAALLAPDGWGDGAVADLTARLEERLGVPALLAAGAFSDLSRRLAGAEQRLAWTLAAASEGIWEHDLASGELRHSARLAASLGHDPGELPVRAEEWRRRIHPDDVETVRRAFAAAVDGSAPLYECDYRLRHEDGSYHWHRDRGQVVRRSPAGQALYMVGTDADIGERRQLDRELAQAQQTAAIGHLAGGLAHDFNNVLTAILGYSTVLLGKLPAESRMRPELEAVQRAGERGAALVRQLLLLSRRQVARPQPVNLNGLLDGLSPTLRRLVGEDVELALDLAPQLGAVRADPGQLEQLILDLALHARAAMPGGGRLSIRTGNLELAGRARAPHTAALQPGSWVVLTVADTGLGTVPETAAPAFEPFPASRETGQAGGVGLATACSIVRRHQGHIACESAPGAGTVFRIFLPRLRGSELPAAEVPPDLAAAVGRETLLLAEDEPAVRGLVRELLEAQGYAVLEAGDGREALVLAHTYGEELPLLVTDVVMPGLGGVELAAEFRRLHPRSAVLFLSGYADRAPAETGAHDPLSGFLAKPFTATALHQKVRELLDRRAAAPA